MNISNSDFWCIEYDSEVINNDNYLLNELKVKKEIFNNRIYVSDKVEQLNKIKILDKFDIINNSKYSNNDILISKIKDNEYSNYIMDKYKEEDINNFCERFISIGELYKNDFLPSDKSEYYNKCCNLKLYLVENEQIILQKIKGRKKWL